MNKFRDFSFKQKKVNGKQKLINIYNSLKDLDGNDIITPWDMATKKQLRQILRQQNHLYTITHKPTGIQRSFETKKHISTRSLRTEIKLLKSKIKRIRNERKLAVTEPLTFFGATVNKHNGVFTEPGSILTLKRTNRKNDCWLQKTPWNKGNFIGIELEFLRNDEDDESYNEDNSEACEIVHELQRKNLGMYCNMTDDPSCGHELRVLLPQSNWKEPLKEILKVIRDLGHEVNNRCGTHVHLDMRSRDVDKAYHNLFAMQDMVYGLVPRSRRDNSYCAKNVYQNYQEEKDEQGEARYRYINTSAYNKFSTLEVRLHTGTLNYKKLRNWVSLLLTAIDHDSKINTEIKTPEDLTKEYNLEDDHLEYIKERYQQFNSEAV